MFGFGNHFDLMPRGFNTQYKCYSVSMLPGDEREDVEKGGKIIMPPSALDVLTRLNIVYPMLFKVTNHKKARTTHCGVLEFVADEGHCYLPHWMMKNLLLEEGDLGQVESTSLPIATFAKFQPQSVDFLDITDPKAVLENALRLFACLTKDDVVAIKYNERIYELLVLELRPGGAVSIIECDMQVDFATPVGYVEPERKKATEMRESEESHTLPEDILRSMVAKPSFPGQGNRLDGKKKKAKDGNDGLLVDPSLIKRGIPDLNYQKGKITFMRKVRRPVTEKKTETPFLPFAGEGQSLR